MHLFQCIWGRNLANLSYVLYTWTGFLLYQHSWPCDGRGSLFICTVVNQFWWGKVSNLLARSGLERQSVNRGNRYISWKKYSSWQCQVASATRNRGGEDPILLLSLFFLLIRITQWKHQFSAYDFLEKIIHWGAIEEK